MATDLIRFVYIIGLGNDPFHVDFESLVTVADLKEAILKNEPSTLRGVDADQLVLYKVEIPDGLPDTLQQSALQALHDSEELKVPSEELSQLFPIKIPEGMISIVVKIQEPNFRKSAIEFTMMLQNAAHWDCLHEIDLAYSNIRLARSSPHLQELQEHLRRKRYINNDTENIMPLGGTLTWVLPTSPNEYFERVPPETYPQDLDYVTKDELLHYIRIRGSESRDKAIFQQNKKMHVQSLLLSFLPRLQSVPDNSWGFGSDLPFHLVAETPMESLSYTPRPDFHICIKGFPHLLLEVHSHQNGRERVHMLLQASCIARIGNWLQDSASRKPVVIMAIYIDEKFKAHQYLLCQPEVESNKVEYTVNKFDLTDPQTASEFTFQLYNFLSAAVADNVGFHEPEKRLATAKTLVEREGYGSLSEYQSLSKRKSEATDSENSSDSSCRPSTHARVQEVFSSMSVQRELTRAGYTIPPPLPEGWSPLTPLKPTMSEATSQSGISVILKTIRDSNERRLLQYLSGIKAPSNHTIPLLDIIDLSIGKTIIVLPQKRPLHEVLDFLNWPDHIVSLCLQFIEGVAFLHRHKVAHLDIKPGNVVVDTEFGSKSFSRLFIIDFDLAEYVESEETMTEGWCGTRGWIAPELGSEDGPKCRYSPILADRWACGRMIRYFAIYFPTHEATRKAILLSFAKRLLDKNPKARPELNQLPTIFRPPKRKLSASQQEPAPKRHAGLKPQVTE